MIAGEYLKNMKILFSLLMVGSKERISRYGPISKTESKRSQSIRTKRCGDSQTIVDGTNNSIWNKKN